MTQIRRKEQQDNDTMAELLDELLICTEDNRINEIYAKLAGHPFFGIMLDRISALELKAQQFDQHEHKQNGQIVLRQ